MKKKRNKKALQKKKNDVYSVYWKKKALIFWGKIVRERDGRCLCCGVSTFLNAHHLLPKEYYPLYMFDLDNGFTLCSKHHKWGKPSAHRCGIWFSCFLMKGFPKIFVLTKQRVYNYGKLENKVNYKEKYEELLEIYERK